MTTLLTGDGSSYDNTLNAPADGDVANGTLFAGPFQRVLNNAKWLKDRVLTGGVEAIRGVANTTALKALSGMPDGVVAIVRGQGLYLYVDPDSTAETLPWVVQPTMGTGRWFHVMNALRNVANGFAALGPTGKVIAPVPNRIVDVQSYEDSGSFNALHLTTTSVTPVDVPDVTVTLAGAEAGDIVLAEATVLVTVDASTTGAVRLVVVDTAATYDAPTRLRGFYGEAAGYETLIAQRTVAAAGNVTVKLRASRNSGSGNVYVRYPSAMRVMLLRP